MNILSFFVLYLLFSPLLMTVVSAVNAFSAKKEQSMNILNRLVKIQSVIAVLITLGLFIFIFKTGDAIVEPGFKLFGIGEAGINLEFILDTLSISFLLLMVLISSVTAWFSTDYIFRERWYFKFFFHFYLMQAGLFLIILSANFTLFVFGWELLGLTSVFLIAFYQERRWPAINGLRAFITYRFCDFFLLLAIFYLHDSIENFNFIELVQGVHPSTGIVVSVFFVIAAMGKSAQYPFSGWLPRAMEGPTPSSAVFYGALSVHAGIYLLLRVYPVIEHSFVARVMLIVIGTLTALQGSLVGRVQVDAKNSLAYATMGQLGIIFIELGLGYNNLAVFHSISHALLRTCQFLQTPSMLLAFHHMESYNQNFFDRKANKGSLSDIMSKMLYSAALEEGYLENIITVPVFIFNKVSTLFMKLHLFLTKRIVCKISNPFIVAGALSSTSFFAVFAMHKTGDLIFLYMVLLLIALYFSLIAFQNSVLKKFGIYMAVSYLLLGTVPLFYFDGKLLSLGLLNLLSTAFALSGIIYILVLIDKRVEEKNINNFLGIGVSAPVMSICFFLFSLSLAGVPGFFSFLFNEVFLENFFTYSATVAVLYLIIAMLNSIIMLSTGFRLFYGQSHDRGPVDLDRNEICFAILLLTPLLLFSIIIK